MSGMIGSKRVKPLRTHLAQAMHQHQAVQLACDLSRGSSPSGCRRAWKFFRLVVPIVFLHQQRL